MKSSKSSGVSRKRRRSSSEDRRPRRYRERSRSSSSEKNRKSKPQRKAKRMRKESPPPAPAKTKISPKVTAPAMEKEKEKVSEVVQKPPEVRKQIKDLLNDKEKLIEHLFQTVDQERLSQLVPDYLKKRSMDELKQLCLKQLLLMSDGCIMHVISGKDSSSYVENAAKDSKGQSTSSSGDLAKQTDSSSTSSMSLRDVAGRLSTRCSNVPSPVHSESPSSDALELYPTTREMESIVGEENLVPLTVKEDIAKDVVAQTGESDLELLELEMRARAIRSLLKARGLPSDDEEEEGGKEPAKK